MSKKEKLGEPKTETRKMSREEWLREVFKDINPEKYAGEGWFATEEYAKPSDISNPYTRAEVGMEGDYYPGITTPRDQMLLKKLLSR